MGMTPTEYFWQEHDVADARLQGIEAALDELWKAVMDRPRDSKRGRPEMQSKAVLRVLAGRWIGHNGPPSTRARLEGYLLEASLKLGDPISKDTAAKLAQEAIDIDRAHDVDLGSL